MKSMYELKLNETIVDGIFEIVRVPGGWLYYDRHSCNNLYMTFVPFHNEFADGVVELTDRPL